MNKEVFRTCNVLPFISCTHLALWRRQGKRPKVHEKEKGSKNFFSRETSGLNTTYVQNINFKVRHSN